MISKIFIICFLCMGLAHAGHAQQLVYRPVNPAFGGDSFNHQWLMASASAQNKYDKKNLPDYKQPGALDGFRDNVNRQLLNDISRSLFGDGKTEGEGDGKMKPGVYNMGTLNVKITEYFGGLNIHIIDINTGEQTNINVPHKP